MIENAKIVLSDKELEMVCNTDWILTKHKIIEKVYALLGEQAASMQKAILNSFLPDEIKATTPKISKGENYLLFPYVMLDYPRYFNKENTMAIRTFFWWGKSVSLHLLLSGNYKEAATNKLLEQFSFLQEQNYSICISETPWQHHFEAENYLPIKQISANEFSDILNRKLFVKIGKEIPLAQWDAVPDFIEKSFLEMLEIIQKV
jgi:hypothetical protein